MTIFRVYTLAVTYFMSALAITAMSMVQGMDPLFIAAVTGLVAATLVVNVKGLNLVSGRLWNVLAIAAFVFFTLDYLSIGRDLVVAASRFLIILLAIKLMDLKRVRDQLTVFALASVQMLAAAASTTSPLFFLILVLFIMGGVWAMIIISIKKDWSAARCGKPEMEVPGSIFGPGFFAAIILASVASLAMTVSLFFVIPRMGAGFFEHKTLNTVKVAGFSDSVDLGSIGPVKLDKTIVMRVELPFYKASGTRPLGRLYVRGTALDRYDGKTWSRDARGRTLVRKDRSGTFRFAAAEGMLLEQKIQLEPLDTEVLFGIGHPVRIMDRPGPGGLVNLWADASGSIYLPAPPFSRLEYTVWSTRGHASEDAGAVGREYLDSSYVEGVEGGERIRALAKDVTAGVSGGLAKAQKLTGYLRTNFEYSLDPGGREGRDPITQFLFETKKGYCEHYATTLAVMLRLVGVPSRIVTGFVPGEWNDFGGYFVVRQQDAHSWVEAYIDGTGWVTFDPTPDPGLVGAYRPSRITLYLDTMKWKWNRYIVHFTGDDQARMAANIEGKTSRVVAAARSAATSARSALSKYAVYILAGVAVVLVLLLGARRQGPPMGIKKLKIPRYYLEMLRLLKKRGLVRSPAETPLEFACRVGGSEVLSITEAFQRERYGGARLSDREIAKVRESLGEMRNA
ncbi:MAG: DUF3488 and DUF4129 domain-containing transglutaminase family protein [Thermodesulfobacteriota bacterium]